MKKKIVIGSVLAVLVSGCLGAYVVLDSKGNGADSEPELVLGYGEVNPEGHIMTESARFFADKVSELTEGRVMAVSYTHLDVYKRQGQCRDHGGALQKALVAAENQDEGGFDDEICGVWRG